MSRKKNANPYDYTYNYGYYYGSDGYYGKNMQVREAIKTLRTNIQFSGIDNPIKSIVLTSTIPGEGKSTIAHLLAIEMANAGKKTLLVDCDMRRPTQRKLFNMKPEKGITAYISGECTLEEAATPTEERNLYFLDVDAKVTNPVELIGSDRFKTAMEEMRNKFDIVIYDSLPLKMFIEPAILAANSDATVFVIRYRFADVKSIGDCFEQLKKANARVIGSVFNGTDPVSGGYGYKSKNRYSGNYGYDYESYDNYSEE